MSGSTQQLCTVSPVDHTMSVPMQATQGIKNEADAQHTLLDGMVRVHIHLIASPCPASQLGWFCSSMRRVCSITLIATMNAMVACELQAAGMSSTRSMLASVNDKFKMVRRHTKGLIHDAKAQALSLSALHGSRLSEHPTVTGGVSAPSVRGIRCEKCPAGP